MTLDSFLDFLNNNKSLDQALAWILTLIILNGLFKLTKGEKARLTSWGLWAVPTIGVVFVRLPESYGFYGIDPWMPLIRFVTYAVVIALAIEDWRRYFKATAGRQSDALKLKQEEGKKDDE